jgi:hypothetical protein
MDGKGVDQLPLAVIWIERRGKSSEYWVSSPTLGLDFCRVAGGLREKRDKWHAFELYTTNKCGTLFS